MVEMRDITRDLHKLSTSGTLPPADHRAQGKAHTAAPRKLAKDMFFLVVISLTAAAVIGQVFLILWVDQL